MARTDEEMDDTQLDAYMTRLNEDAYANFSERRDVPTKLNELFATIRKRQLAEASDGDLGHREISAAEEMSSTGAVENDGDVATAHEVDTFPGGITRKVPPVVTAIAIDAESPGPAVGLVQLEQRATVRTILSEVCVRIGANDVDVRDSGDGVLAFFIGNVAVPTVVRNLVDEVAFTLGAYNRRRTLGAGLRLRVALHRGTDVAGQVLTTVARLADSTALRDALARSPFAPVGIIFSDTVFQEAVSERHPGIDPAAFEYVSVENPKLARVPAWISLLGTNADGFSSRTHLVRQASGETRRERYVAGDASGFYGSITGKDGG